MQRILIVLGLFAVVLAGLPSANAQSLPFSVAQEAVLPKSYPIPGSDLLRGQERIVREYAAAHPEILAEMRLRKSAAWNFNVGDTTSWYADNLTDYSRYQVLSTCRAVGTHCYVFVEDSSWSNGRVTQTAVDSVRSNFDSRTPADPAKGIYQTLVESFGTPPDVDSDPKIVILILNIRDGYSGSGGFVAGYFYSYNEMTTPSYPTSNKAEIYFLDCNPLNLTTTPGITTGMSTTAHEFQHMIHWNHDMNEVTFVDEMCSVSAEIACGFSIYNQSYYVNNTNRSLLTWGSLSSEVLRDYSRAARYGVYLRDQFGVGLFSYIVSNAANGLAGVDAALTAYGRSEQTADFFPRWETANILDDRTVSPVPWYGYLYPGLLKAVARTYPDPNVSLQTDTVEALAARFLSFTGGSNLAITFNSGNAALRVNAVEIGSGSKRVLAVTPGVQFSEPEFGTTYTTIHFVVMNTGSSSQAIYTYSASGTGASSVVELKWDSNPAVGYLPLTAGDTCAVQFDAVSGGKLDSVRVQMYPNGSLTGGVWRYTGSGAHPLGTPLTVPTTATNATAGLSWVTVDVRAANITTNLPFVVGFVDPGSSSNPHVVVSLYVTSGSYHSYTYLHSPGGWYYLNQNGDTLFLYMVRAYLTVGTTDVPSVAPVPTSFALGQNYPNPFNPSTTISYQLAGVSEVTLRVFDILGREVRLLVRERQDPGTYRVAFAPEGLTSGTYFYRLQAGAYTETRKMLYVR